MGETHAGYRMIGGPGPRSVFLAQQVDNLGAFASGGPNTAVQTGATWEASKISIFRHCHPIASTIAGQ